VLAVDTAPLPRRRRLPGMLLVALLVAVVGTAGVLVAATRTIGAVPRVPGVAEVLSPANSTVDNYLLVGSDSRSEGDPNTGETGGPTGNRSDTIMVLRYDRATGGAALLSIPRDLWVDVPGHDGKRRINSAYNDGADVLVRTVQQALGLPVHHYVEIDFVGFTRLVEALGGISICFPYATRDTNTGLNIIAPGCHLLDGKHALAYARSRHFEELKEDGQWHEDPTSDIGRAKRQREFVNITLQTAISRLRTNPFDAGRLVSAIGTGLRLDEDLDPVEAAGSLRSAVDGGLAAYSLPVVPQTIDGNAVLLLGDGADGVLGYFRGDAPPPAG